MLHKDVNLLIRPTYHTKIGQYRHEKNLERDVTWFVIDTRGLRFEINWIDLTEVKKSKSIFF